MSLNIITDITKVDRDNFIWDVESIGCIIPDNDYCKKVLNSIEKGSYLDDSAYIDRFGFKLYSDFMSTTAKAYICLDRFPEKVINFIEVGKGSGDLLLEKSQGSIYIPANRVSNLFSSTGDKGIDVNLNGKNFKRYYDLIEYAEEEL